MFISGYIRFSLEELRIYADRVEFYGDEGVCMVYSGLKVRDTDGMCVDGRFERMEDGFGIGLNTVLRFSGVFARGRCNVMGVKWL